MEQDLENYLEQISKDMRQTPGTRARAAHLLKGWQAGIVPAGSRLRELRRMLDRPNICARLRGDGSCVWLRKFAHLEGLPLPDIGKKAYCHRRLEGNDAQRYDCCTGYAKKEEGT